MKLKYLLLPTLFLASTIHTTEDLVCKPAPLFKADALFPNGSVKTFNLKDFIGQKLVLYFYPMDNTPGCTKQAKNFRDNIEKLKKEGITLIGISCDSIKSHKKFQKKHQLPYILVSDSRKHQTISKKYGTKSILMSKRKTFLIDECGTIFKKFDSVNIEEQVDEIIKAFKKNK
jgi:peroxiredoxin Q/BCP